MSDGAFAYTVRRAALTGVAIAAFMAGITASAAAAEGLAFAGVTAENPGGRVLSVSPTGFAWHDGIRAGQLVVALADTDSATGWRLETTDSSGIHVSREQPFDDALRDSWTLAVAATFAGALALVFVRTHRRWVAPSSAAAFLFASMPLQIQGSPGVSTAVLALASVLPITWLAMRLPRRTYAAAGIAIGLAFLAIWAGARMAGDPLADGLEPLRAVVAGYGTALFLVVATVGPVLRGEGLTLMRPRLADLILVAIIGGAAAASVFVVHAPPLLTIIGAALAMLVLPAVRSMAARRIEHALLADVRAHVALEASEAERARLARELHDVPLQHLTSVIRHLESKPDAAEETEGLRVIAAQLREAATNLRPPVLDDLGLGAALDFLASETTSESVRVYSDVADDSGPHPTSRPPTDVELAMFRVAQEAVSNAVQHAAAHTVRIEGHVAQDAVDIVVRDDGRGFPEGRAREAVRSGRLGLASMRRRAEAVDADLSIDRAAVGTAVAVRWRR
ncbi:MAG TPA: ATP-binding protein [Candidatus Acidoferrales bacterium]|nr:ATP-binding protein [Candidatus Acidoferrales bacterium]